MWGSDVRVRLNSATTSHIMVELLGQFVDHELQLTRKNRPSSFFRRANILYPVARSTTEGPHSLGPSFRLNGLESKLCR